MRVERFSIGFGPTLLGFEHRGRRSRSRPSRWAVRPDHGDEPERGVRQIGPDGLPESPPLDADGDDSGGTGGQLPHRVRADAVRASRLRHAVEDAEDSRAGGRAAGRSGRDEGGRRTGRCERPGGRRRSPDYRRHSVVARKAGRHQGPARRQAVRFQVTADNKSGVYQVGIQIGPIDARTPIGSAERSKRRSSTRTTPRSGSRGALRDGPRLGFTPIPRGRSGLPSRLPRPPRGGRSTSWKS